AADGHGRSWWRRGDRRPPRAQLPFRDSVPDMEPRPAADSRSILVRWMGVTDANTAGFVHGGTVMRLCDEVAGIAAIRHCRQRVVTADADRMAFLHPVHVGELLHLSAMANAAWRTSMEVGARVVRASALTGASRPTASA